MKEFGKDGGQGGSTLSQSCQSVRFPNSQKTPFENTNGSSPLPNRTAEAAAWLAANPEEIVQPVIPFVRDRFGLSSVQAIAALKTAHTLRYDGA